MISVCSVQKTVNVTTVSQYMWLMPSFDDKTGNRYGRLVVTEQAPNHKKSVMWRCQCDCGNVCVVRGTNLANGQTQSCGCLHKDIQRERLTGNSVRATHRKTKTPQFAVWSQMIQRCTNENHAAWARYGGRGIKVCDRWLESYENFYDDMGEVPPKMTLDRIDNDGDYTPENCRWVSRKNQANNRSSNHWITVRGVSKTITQWANDLGTTDATIRQRIKMGWSDEKAVLTPVKHQKRRRAPIGQETVN